MATMKISISSILIIGSFMMMLSSCKKDNTTSPTDTTTYSTSDLEGVWSGTLRIVGHGGTSNGMDTTINMNMTFGHNGTFIPGWGLVYISISGNLTVDEAGTISGIVTTTHKTDSVNVETTTMNWAGCTFETKTKINVNMNWPWVNTAPGNGYFLITGSINKQ